MRERADPEAPWDELRRAVSGQLVLPGSAAYQDAAQAPFISWFDVPQPRAVVRCRDPRDVAAVIAFAGEHGIGLATRSGGHCSAGFSSTGGIVIDLAPQRSVSVEEGVVRIEAGALLGHLQDGLLRYGLTIPAGTCPSVGIGGITLGGGHGVLGRAYGLTLDHLISAQVVLASGRVVECDERQHADLFWALRGAGGGNFGVVTSFIFCPRPAPRMTNFRLTWPYNRAGAVVSAWQDWAVRGPDELAADLALTAPADPAAEPFVEVFGAALCTERATGGLLDDLVARVGSSPGGDFRAELSYRDTARYQAGQDQAAQRRVHRFTKSEFFDRPLPSAAVGALAEGVSRGRASGQYRSVLFAPWGGAYNRRPPDATAFAHRDQLFLLEHLAFVDGGAPEQHKQDAVDWVTSSWSAMRPCGSGRVYPNFPDPELDDWGHAYYGANYARLVKIKGRYDPHGVFRFAQSLPVQ
jgi:FAD/FMN-containing dehydrogenase